MTGEGAAPTDSTDPIRVVGTVGRGHVGLSLAMTFAAAGFGWWGSKRARNGLPGSPAASPTSRTCRRLCCTRPAARSPARRGTSSCTAATRSSSASRAPLDAHPEPDLTAAVPYVVLERIERALDEQGKPVNGTRILLLGVSHKAGIGNLRESPALKILELLTGRGAAVTHHDAHVPELPNSGLASVDFEAGIADADLVVIATAHPGVDYARLRGKPVVDLRGVMRRLP